MLYYDNMDSRGAGGVRFWLRSGVEYPYNPPHDIPLYDVRGVPETLEQREVFYKIRHLTDYSVEVDNESEGILIEDEPRSIWIDGLRRPVLVHKKGNSAFFEIPKWPVSLYCGKNAPSSICLVFPNGREQWYSLRWDPDLPESPGDLRVDWKLTLVRAHG